MYISQRNFNFITCHVMSFIYNTTNFKQNIIYQRFKVKEIKISGMDSFITSIYRYIGYCIMIPFSNDAFISSFVCVIWQISLYIYNIRFLSFDNPMYINVWYTSGKSKKTLENNNLTNDQETSVYGKLVLNISVCKSNHIFWPVMPVRKFWIVKKRRLSTFCVCWYNNLVPSQPDDSGR